MVKKFEETGSVTDIVSAVHHRFTRSTENIAAVSESIAEDPNEFIPRRSQELGLYYGIFLPAIEGYVLENMWFQQDGATCHTTRANMALLQETFPDR